MNERGVIERQRGCIAHRAVIRNIDTGNGLRHIVQIQRTAGGDSDD